MRRTIVCLGLLAFETAGCTTYDFEGAKARAIATAQEECQARGGKFVLISVEKHEDRHDISVVGRCEHPDSEPKALSKGGGSTN